MTAFVIFYLVFVPFVFYFRVVFTMNFIITVQMLCFMCFGKFLPPLLSLAASIESLHYVYIVLKLNKEVTCSKFHFGVILQCPSL